jgi:hypothetical protein
MILPIILISKITTEMLVTQFRELIARSEYDISILNKIKNLESKKKRKLEIEITKSDNDSDMVLPIIIME